MKVAFLQNDSFVKIAVMLLCAVLKEKGHETEVFIESGETNFMDAVLSSNSDLFAFSCTTGWENWTQETSAKLKERSATPILIGGPHATFFPELVKNENIDWLCMGEGEDAIVELMNVLESNPEEAYGIPNICYAADDGSVIKNDVRVFIEDLDKLPIPDFTPYVKYSYLVDYNRYMYPVMTGRGCPYHCSYCFNKSYKEIYRGKGRYLRKRSPKNVISELKHVKNTFGVQKLNFVDDSFFGDTAWLEEFAELYIREIRLPFIINVEATQVSERCVELVKKMGCICARMGLETGNQELRQKLLKKRVADDHIRKAAVQFKKYRIYLSTYNILGLPGESLEQALQTYTMNREINTDFIQCSLLQPYPGTDIFSYVRDNGYLDEEDAVLGESFFVSTTIKLENKKEIINLQKLMQIFSMLHASRKIVLFFIKVPDNHLYSLLFKISFVFNKIRTQKIKIIPLMKLAFHSFGYMKQKL